MLRPMFLPAPMMKAIGLVMVETRGVCKSDGAVVEESVVGGFNVLEYMPVLMLEAA